MIYLLVALLSIMLIINIKIHNKCFCAPAVIFNISFWFTSIWACAFADDWDLKLHKNTFYTIIGAVVIFSIAALIRKSKYFRSRGLYDRKRGFEVIPNDKIKTWVVILIQIVVLYIYVRRVLAGTDAGGLQRAISLRYSNAIEIRLPLAIRVMILAIKSWGYWFSMQFARNLVYRRKIEMEYIIAITISILSTLLTGSRGDAILMLCSIAIFIMLFEYRMNPGRRHVNIRKAVLTLLIVLFCIWIFPRVGNMLGRTTKMGTMEYIGAYLGAEIKNLDTFLNTNRVPIRIGTKGIACFSSIEGTIGRYLGMKIVKPRILHMHQRVNGIYLGNVYTMLYEPLFDFGYVYCFVIVAILGFVMQGLFERAFMGSESKNVFSLLMFGYCMPILVFSFFAFWFGNQVICTGFLYVLFGWWFIKILYYGIDMTITFIRPSFNSAGR